MYLIQQFTSADISEFKSQIDAIILTHDAELANYTLTDTFGAFGNIYRDNKARFSDGQFIQTTKILCEYKDYILTCNTVYKLITEV